MVLIEYKFILLQTVVRLKNFSAKRDSTDKLGNFMGPYERNIANHPDMVVYGKRDSTHSDWSAQDAANMFDFI